MRFKTVTTCWSDGRNVVEVAVRQCCRLCAARVTWCSFHSNASDAAPLCSQCVRGRCQMFQLAYPRSAISQPVADVKASNRSETAVKTAQRNCLKISKIEVEETLPRSNRDPHSQRLTGVPPEGATSQVMVALAVRSPEGAPLRSLGHWHVALSNGTTYA